LGKGGGVGGVSWVKEYFCLKISGGEIQVRVGYTRFGGSAAMSCQFAGG